MIKIFSIGQKVDTKIKWQFLVFLLLLMPLLHGTPVRANGPSVMITVSDYQARNSAVSPRAVQLKYSGENNGKMYATFEYGVLNNKGMQTFPIFESLDSGKTWNRVGDIEDTKNNWGMGNCPQLFELPEQLGTLPAGTIIAIGNSVPLNLSKTSMDMYYSTDLGRTWTYMSTVATGGKNVMGDDPVWEPFMLYANGKLVCYYSDETDPKYAQKIVHKITEDGIHWSTAVDDVAWTDSGMRPGMPVVAQLENGYYIMTYEGVGLPDLPTNYKISLNPNDPEHWDAADPGITYGYGGSPYVITMSDGTVVATAAGTSDIYVNTKKDVSGEWIRYSSPIETGYNRQIIELSNGELFIFSCGFPDQHKANSVKYTTMDIKTMAIPKDAVYIINKSNQKYMCVWQTSKSDNSRVVQWSNSGSMDLRWIVQKIDGTDHYKFVNVNSNKVLTVAANGTVVQSDYNGSLAQQWKIENQDNGYCKIVNVDRNLPLSQKSMSYNSGNVNDMALFLKKNADGDTDLWQFANVNKEPEKVKITIDMDQGGSISPSRVTIKKGTVQYFIINVDRGYSLKDVTVNGKSIGAKTVFKIDNVTEDVKIEAVFNQVSKKARFIKSKAIDKLLCTTQASKQEGASIIEWQFNNGAEQFWIFEQIGGTELYKIVNVNSGKVLSVINASKISGTALIQTTYVEGKQESLWKLEKKYGGYYSIINANSNLAVTRGNPDSRNDRYAEQKTYEGSDDQLWDLEYVVSRTGIKISSASALKDKKENWIQAGAFVIIALSAILVLGLLIKRNKKTL